MDSWNVANPIQSVKYFGVWNCDAEASVLIILNINPIE